MLTHAKIVEDRGCLHGLQGPVTIACSGCAVPIQRQRETLTPRKIARASGIFCSTRCARLHHGRAEWETCDGVVGRRCKACLEWRPLVAFAGGAAQGKSRTCNACWEKRPLQRYNSYKRKASRRGLLFDMSFSDFKSLIGEACFYCASRSDGVGLDRVDGSQGYSMANVVPACGPCNMGRNTQLQKDFLERCRVIARRFPPTRITSG